MAIPEYARRVRFIHTSVWIPSRTIEYGYYFVVFYTMAAAFFGIEIPLVASGLMGLIASFCIMKFRSHSKDIFASIALLLACAISFILVQVVIHGASVLDESQRAFINWILGMII